MWSVVWEVRWCRRSRPNVLTKCTRYMTLIPSVMKGLEKSMTFSLSAVMVRPATARSAFCNKHTCRHNYIYTASLGGNMMIMTKQSKYLVPNKRVCLNKDATVTYIAVTSAQWENNSSVFREGQAVMINYLTWYLELLGIVWKLSPTNKVHLCGIFHSQRRSYKPPLRFLCPPHKRIVGLAH